jgi:hypothetical protein
MRLQLFVLVMVISVSAAANGDVQHQRDPNTGLSSWKAEAEGFSIEFVQIVPDYVRAVYASRGLPEAVISGVTSYCVFGTIVRNESDAPLSYRVADWRFISEDGQAHRLKTKSEWVEEWRKLGVAYRWSILPDDQTFEVGDWGQGFTTVKLPPGSTFDLEYSWRQHDKTYTGKITGMRCVPENPVAP